MIIRYNIVELLRCYPEGGRQYSRIVVEINGEEKCFGVDANFITREDIGGEITIPTVKSSDYPVKE